MRLRRVHSLCRISLVMKVEHTKQAHQLARGRVVAAGLP